MEPGVRSQTPTLLLEHYRALESRAHAMLASAQAARWDDVRRERSDCQLLIAELEDAKRSQSLTPAENLERLRILKTIVLCDGQTRRLSSDRVTLFDEVLSARRHSR